MANRCQLRTAIYIISNGTTGPIASLVAIKPGWFVQSSKSVLVLATNLATNSHFDSIRFINIDRTNARVRSSILYSSCVILPRYVKDLTIYNFATSDTLENIRPTVIPNVKVNVLEVEMPNEVQARHRAEMFEENVRISERENELEVAILEVENDEHLDYFGTTTMSLSTIRLEKDVNGIFTITGRAKMKTEPPLSLLQPDWKYFNNELVFMCNDRISTLARSDPNWEISCEIIITKLNFVKSDYETGIIYRNRTERAFGYYDQVEGYDHNDWSDPRGWSVEPWAEWSQRFLSQFSLYLSKYQKPRVTNITA